MQVAPTEVELEVPTVEFGRWQQPSQNDELAALPNAHFITRDGVKFAGTHLLLDLWGAKHLDDKAHIEQAMRDCVDACGATLLHIHLHHFTPSFGVSGVAVLAAAFDVFMCGDAQPENAIAVLKRAFFPERIEVNEELRGKVDK